MPSKLHPPKFYCELSGISADSICLAIKNGELKASDLRRAGGRRARWYISEDSWQAWLDVRANVQIEPVVRANVQIEPVVREPHTARQYV